jgi:hypothetical protein
MFHPGTTALAALAWISSVDSSHLALVRPLEKLVGVVILRPEYGDVDAAFATIHDTYEGLYEKI